MDPMTESPVNMRQLQLYVTDLPTGTIFKYKNQSYLFNGIKVVSVDTMRSGDCSNSVKIHDIEVTFWPKDKEGISFDKLPILSYFKDRNDFWIKTHATGAINQDGFFYSYHSANNVIPIGQLVFNSK